ncbi:hypothetical protein FRC05_003870 [Tulasnella sp. 425]|nr:hypothetical protein FRC05_003870 [Tulasnella sp. 425]
MPPKQSLISTFLVKFTPEEKAKRAAAAFAQIGDGLGKMKAKAKLSLQSRAEKERVQALERQRKHRAKIRNEDIAAGLHNSQTGAIIKEAKLVDKKSKPNPKPTETMTSKPRL